MAEASRPGFATRALAATKRGAVAAKKGVVATGRVVGRAAVATRTAASSLAQRAAESVKGDGPLVSRLVKANYVYTFIVIAVCFVIGGTTIAGSLGYDTATTDGQKSRIAASTFFFTLGSIIIVLYFIS